MVTTILWILAGAVVLALILVGAHSAGSVRPVRVLRCAACGATQRKGEWEAAMDAHWRGLGAAGFINLGGDPQCLRCTSRELADPAAPAPKVGPEVEGSAEDLVHVMEPYFRGRQEAYDESRGGKERVVAIGRSLYEKDGHQAMLAAFRRTVALAHRRYGYTGSGRLLEMDWDGVGEWLG